jgi:hypothetical protein
MRVTATISLLILIAAGMSCARRAPEKPRELPASAPPPTLLDDRAFYAA